jgi:hypothetical protein
MSNFQPFPNSGTHGNDSLVFFYVPVSHTIVGTEREKGDGIFFLSRKHNRTAMIDFEDDCVPTKPNESRKVRAEAFLLDFLAYGPVPANKLLADAKAAGISRSALYEAKALCDARDINVVIRSEKRHDGWWWRLKELPTNSTRREDLE